MELMSDPEFKKRYEKCKKIVKIWECKFKKKFRRIPSKHDIREADKSIRSAYSTYFRMKTAILDETLSGLDGFQLEDDSFTQPSASVSCASDKEPSLCASESVIPKEEEQLCTNTDKTWGDHLSINKCDRTEPNKSSESKLSNVNESFTKKLFVGSKFTKRNPRKSLSLSQSRTKSFKSSAAVSFSQPVSSNQSSFEISYEDLGDNIVNDLDISVKYTQPAPQVHSQSVNLIQNLISNEVKVRTLHSVDKGWLQRVAKETNTELVNPELEAGIKNDLGTNLNYDSDDIIENSDEESSSLFLHIAKKRRFNLPEIARVEKCIDKTIVEKTPEKPNDGTNTNLITVDHTNPKRLDFANIFNKNSCEKEELVGDKTNTKDVKESSENVYEFANPDEDNAKTISTKKKRTYKSRKKTTEDKIVVPKKTEAVRKSSRVPKPLVEIQKNVQHSDSDENVEDPFQCDSDQDPDYSETVPDKCRDIASEEPLEDVEQTSPDRKPKDKTKKSPRQPKTPKTPRAKKSPKQPKAKTPGKGRGAKSKPDSEAPDATEPDTYELEYSIKPRTVTVPRFKTIPTTASDVLIPNAAKPVAKDKREQTKEKLEQKIASGSLNENFVRIDLRKKVYSRGHKHINYSKFKKRQWVDKRKAKALCGPEMDMGGCDGGKLTCFRCGGEGHFAQRCPNNKGDTLLPLEADKEVCPYPTLEEAAKMAQGSVSAIRKPTIRIPDASGGVGKLSGIVADTDDECEDANDKGSDVGESRGATDDFEYLEDSFEEDLVEETLRIEDLVPKIDVKLYVDQEKSVKPLYGLGDGESLIATPPDVYEALKIFNHTSFRPGQEAAVMRILSGLSTLVTLSTGSGKSLCYQLPAYLYSRRQKCISLVISPLVSLMEDQVTGIPSILKAACLHTNQTKPQREKIMEQIKQGNLDILLVSPEAIVAGEKSTGFGSLLRQLPPIAFACIDEAHCVSQWSHNFRPSYLMICRVLRDRLGVKTVLGLTATATRATSDSIVEHLQIPDGRLGIISDVPLPDNLFLNVSRDENRDRALLRLLQSDRFKELRSIIVYCTRREECERISGFLRTALQDEARAAVAALDAQADPHTTTRKRKRVNNSQAECYHAGMSASRRRTVQRQFMSGELRIVVATVAFGMGINKSDIRSVIHYNLPRNFESYVQEVGRAGRDGLPAYCHLFLDSRGRDENELKRHVHSNSMDRHVIRKLLQKIFVPCSCPKKSRCPKHEVAFSVEESVRHLDIPEEIISTLLCYLELHERRFIEVLSPAYTVCKVISYGGPTQIRKSALECPPLAMALALRKNKDSGGDENVLEFPVVDIAAAIGWDSGITKHKLKNLEWISVDNQPKRSLLSVNFSNLGFRLLAPGNLTDSELDEALDSLYARVVDQERTAILQLHAICTTVVSGARPRFELCYQDEAAEKSPSGKAAQSGEPSLVGLCDLKSKIREYFESPKPLEMLPEIEIKPVNEEHIIADIRVLVHMYRDNVFTGRAIARIFHGIQSPNYPAVIWGRCKFWRAHLSSDFNTIIQIATKELIRLRRTS